MAVPFCALLILAAACGGGGGKGQPTPSPQATGTPAAGTPTAEPSPAVTPRLSTELSEDFPEDFPQYPDATVSQTARFADQIIVTLETEDAREDVATFFRQALETPPWEVLTQQDAPEQGQSIIDFRHLDEPIRGRVSVFRPPDDSAPTAITIRLTVPESVGTPLPGAPITPTPEEDGSTPEGAGS